MITASRPNGQGRAFPDGGIKAERAPSRSKPESVRGQRHKSSLNSALLFVNGGYLAHSTDRVHP